MQLSILIWAFSGLRLICFKKVNAIYFAIWWKWVYAIYTPLCLLIILPYVKSLYVFVITSLHKEPPSFISCIHQAIRWSVGLVITTSHLLVIIYQAQSYKQPVENNGSALPKPSMTLLSQRHGLSEIVMGVIRGTSHVKQYIWMSALPLTGSIMANC